MKYAIDEFKALREEVKRCESETLSSTLYVITAVILAVGLTEKTSIPTPVVALLVQVVLLWGMHQFGSLSSLRQKLSSYIHVVLEPALPGIQWERLSIEFGRLEARHPSRPRRIAEHFGRRLSHIFFLLTCVSGGLSVTSLYSHFGISQWMTVFYGLVLLFLHILSSALVVRTVFHAHRYERYVEHWRSILARERDDG